MIDWKEIVLKSGNTGKPTFATNRKFICRLGTHDGYLPKHFWPKSYLGFLKSKVFCRKKQSNDRNHGKATHSAKMGGDSLAENTSDDTPKFIRPICPFGPKAWDIIK